MLISIRAPVDTIGVDILGFIGKDVGTHPNRAAAAMMMYLAKEPVYTIMLIGRWSSDVFLAYIEKQVKEFTKGVSKRMPQTETFCNVPSAHQPRTEGSETQSQSHHRRELLKNVCGRQGSLRHQLRPRN